MPLSLPQWHLPHSFRTTLLGPYLLRLSMSLPTLLPTSPPRKNFLLCKGKISRVYNCQFKSISSCFNKCHSAPWLQCTWLILLPFVVQSSCQIATLLIHGRQMPPCAVCKLENLPLAIKLIPTHWPNPIQFQDKQIHLHHKCSLKKHWLRGLWLHPCTTWGRWRVWFKKRSAREFYSKDLWPNSSLKPTGSWSPLHRWTPLISFCCSV